MRFTAFLRCCLLLFSLSAILFGAQVTSAHERREVGKYQLVVGFIAEPLVEGVKNGVDLRVTEGDKPVEGLEKTLKVEVIQGTVARTWDLRAVFREPGHYTADLIPTAPGQYIFRFSGTIGGVQVNERFESGPGRFNHVESAQELEFPDKLPSLREVGGVARSAQEEANDAGDAASSAMTIGVVGVLLGGLGSLLGIAGLVVALRRR